MSNIAVLADDGSYEPRIAEDGIALDYAELHGTAVTCGNCGCFPQGEGCYHICFNSVAYYSPEREKQDDLINDGSDDIRERYAATVADANLSCIGDES